MIIYRLLIILALPTIIISFCVASFRNPGYVTPEHDFLYLLQNIHPLEMCPDCEVLRTPRSRHCAICNKCVERFDHHCPWLNNCVGVRNHNAFFVFLISLTLTFLLIIFSNVLSIVDPCDIELARDIKGKHDADCPLEFLCLDTVCEKKDFRDLMIIISSSIVLFFSFAVGILFWVQCGNYAANRTSNERFARRGRS